MLMRWARFLYCSGKIQGGARNVIPLIVHITHFYFTKAYDTWYRINPHRLENCSWWKSVNCLFSRSPPCTKVCTKTSLSHYYTLCFCIKQYNFHLLIYSQPPVVRHFTNWWDLLHFSWTTAFTCTFAASMLCCYNFIGMTKWYDILCATLYEILTCGSDACFIGTCSNSVLVCSRTFISTLEPIWHDHPECSMSVELCLVTLFWHIWIQYLLICT